MKLLIIASLLKHSYDAFVQNLLEYVVTFVKRLGEKDA